MLQNEDKHDNKMWQKKKKIHTYYLVEDINIIKY